MASLESRDQKEMYRNLTAILPQSSAIFAILPQFFQAWGTTTTPPPLPRCIVHKQLCSAVPQIHLITSHAQCRVVER